MVERQTSLSDRSQRSNPADCTLTHSTEYYEIMEDFINRLLAARTKTHILHLRAGSYGHHVALDKFYDALSEKIDLIAEVYKGRHGSLDKLTVVSEEVEDATTKNILAFLTDLSDSISEVLDETPTEIENILTELLADTHKAMYLVKLT